MKKDILWVVIVVLALAIGLCAGYIFGNRQVDNDPMLSIVGTYKSDYWRGDSAALSLRADGTCFYPTGARGTWTQEGTSISISIIIGDEESLHEAEIVPNGVVLHGCFFEKIS